MSSRTVVKVPAAAAEDEPVSAAIDVAAAAALDADVADALAHVRRNSTTALAPVTLGAPPPPANADPCASAAGPWAYAAILEVRGCTEGLL
jgi:hypothetical protein